VKRSRRERKISKVMGEFKDGSLKSGGSGRKVTNPKQAIAIALSEANRMNQGGIVGLAQMQSPFANSIRPRRQTTMGPGSYKTGIIGDQRIPPVASPMQRNFMQMQNQMRGMQQNPLELYQGYLGQKYIGPMAEEQQNKISQFVGAVSQAERQAFGQQQGGKTFGGRLQPGMPGSGLVPPMNQAPDVMPPMNMNQAPAVMPDGYSDRAAEFDPVFMNQGGMMYSDIMNRPMFQTPQQRQGMGIMAGVAPVRGYEEGGMATPEYTPKFMREEDSEEDGLGRMLFELFIVDPDDPVDVGLASASAAMVAGGITAPGAVATQLARMGYKGKKLFDAVKKVESLGKPSKPDAGVIRQAMAPVGATYGASQTGRMVGEVPEIVEAVGGIAQLSGGGFLEGLIQSIPGKGGKAIEILSRGIDAGRVAIDDILNALKRGDIEQREAEALVAKADKVLGEPGAETVAQGQRLVLKKPKMQAEDLATPPESAMPTPPKAPAPAKVADEVTETAEEAAKKKPSVKRQVATGTAKAAGIAGGAGVASDIGLGTNFISTGLEKIGDTYGAVRDDVAATLEMPEIVALRERVNPDTGERVELTESVMEQVDLNKDGKISDEERKAIKEKADKAVAGQQKPDTGTGTPKPEATGIMKFLFGKDGIGGDPGAVGKTMNYLADPRTRYALARAAESRPGVVDRNFFTDFTLGQAEYDQLQGKDETALMQNYEFLKAAGKSDDEIFDLLLSKDTASDQAERYQDQVLSLYTAAREDARNTDKSDAELLEEARLTAAAIILNQSVATPKDSDVTEIPLQPAVQ
jgi:hypothetical protein